MRAIVVLAACASGFRSPRIGNGTGCIHAAPGNYRAASVRSLDRGANDGREFILTEGKIFTCPAGGEQGGGIVRGQPGNMILIGLGGEFQIPIKMRDRKGQKACGHTGLELLGR